MKIKNSVSEATASRRLRGALALLILSVSGSVAATTGGWEEVKPTAISSNYPTGCAYDALMGSPSSYKYFIKNQDTPTKPANLLIFLNGGGACWDPNTCGLNDPKLIAFIPAIFQTATPEGNLIDCSANTPGTCDKPISFETGVLDDTKADNPFKNYTKAFVPYCTGDIFWGNSDTSYNGVTIHHRGYGNLLAVLESLWETRGYKNNPPDKVVIAGMSAGAYGAIAAFVEVEKRLPQWKLFNNTRKTRTYLIADSGNGIVTDGFLEKAINGSQSRWGVNSNTPTLPDYLRATLQQGAVGLPVRIYGELALRYPKSRFAQFQTAYDEVQIGFLYTMKSVDALYAQLPQPNPALTLAEWTARMRTAVNLTAAAPTYRFYTAAGYNHTALISTTAAQQGGPVGSNDFYSEKTANIPLSEWVNDMLNKPNLQNTGNWQNITCFPNCLPLPPQ